MRVIIAGAGGTGGYFGGLLARAGHDVTFIARGAHLAALRKHGLRVKSKVAGDFTLPVTATDIVETGPPVDLALFCVKTYDTDAMADLVRPRTGPRTMILSVQNGVDNEARLGRQFGDSSVLGAIAYIVAAVADPGVIEHSAGPGKIVFGELAGGSSDRARRLLAVLTAAGIAAEMREDVNAAIWEKFLFICAYSGITALTRLPIGPILDCAESAELFRGLLREVEAVARASGVALADGCIEQALATARGMGPGGRSSLYFDLASGHRMELDALNGVIVRMGREFGVPTPLNFAVYAALKPYANGAVNAV